MNAFRRVSFAAIGLMLCLPGCGRPQESGATSAQPLRTVTSAPPTADPAPVTDRALEPHRLELLDLAFDTAAAIPVEPHIKDRSRAQAEVVEACLELGQVSRAQAFADRIDNWRRGAMYAAIALYGAEHSDAAGIDIESYLAQAEAIAATAEGWRRDEIRVRMAQTRARLGDADASRSLQRDLEPTSVGQVDGLTTTAPDAAAFEAELASLDTYLSSGDLDITRNALTVCVAFFDRFYDDPARREQAETRIKAAWGTIPVMARLDLLAALIESALAYADTAKASALVDEGFEIIDGSRWTAEYEVPARGRLAGLRGRAGNHATALRDLDTAVATYDSGLRQIADVFRAETLRPVAEAYHAIGDDAAARRLFARVVEAGAENPNARPRAQDLAATCIALARGGMAPDEALWSRLREIREGLVAPW